jgi:hypothetical protein
VGSLSSAQKAILIGSLLGDGSLRRQNNRNNALFEVNHSYKQEEYVNWKCNYFQEYILTKPKFRKNNGARIAYRFTTQSLPVFTEYYYWFYSDGKKIIPIDLELNALSLAVWFMDDGSKSYSSYYLNTQQFSIPEQEFLIRLLFSKFGLTSKLNRDKQYFRLRFSTNSSRSLEKIIEPYIISSLRYKLIYDPVTTELKNEISD